MKKKMTMRSKLTVGYMFIVVLCLICIELFLYRTNRIRIFHETRSTLEQINGSGVTQMDTWLHGMDYVLIELINDTHFLHAWKQYQNRPNGENREALKKFLLAELRNNTAFRRLAVYDSEGRYCVTGLTDITESDVSGRARGYTARYDLAESYTRLFIPPEEDFWSNSALTVVSVIRPIYTAEGILGFLEVDMKSLYFETFIDNYIGTTAVGDIIVWGDKNEILLTDFADEDMTARDLAAVANKYERFQEIGRYYVATGLSNYFNCRLISVIDSRYVTVAVRKIMWDSFWVICLFFLVGIVILLLLLRYELSPLDKLVRYMQNTSLDDGGEKIVIGAKNYETDVLVETYKDMLARLKEHHRQASLMKDFQSSTLFSILQREMNPHFLYNTLGAIAYLCDEGQNEEAVKACFDLSDILRYSSKYDSTSVYLEEELVHLEAYLSIMKNRYRQRLIYSLVYDEEALEYLVPRLTLQPLVENAIKYSLLETEEVVVRVELRMSGAELSIVVSDNGSGMEQEKIQEIEAQYLSYTEWDEFDELCQRVKFGGMGLVGTLTRLRLLFADRFSYRLIGKNEAHGTSVVLLIRVGEEENVYSSVSR